MSLEGDKHSGAEGISHSNAKSVKNISQKALFCNSV
jgi:hypothetical protein